MQKIPKTFCPAKWEELHVNFNYNYVYSCCKATPIKFVNSINEVLEPQRQNLLNGVQDPSCEYCWSKENQGGVSRRLGYFKNTIDITPYKNGQVGFREIEINLGNECNFQCTYCNPKFSSKWESDVNAKPYPTFTDRFFYAVDEKNKDSLDTTINWLSEINNIHTLSILGGEPLLNKNFFKVANTIKSDILAFSTNLSCGKSKIDEVLKLADRYQGISLNISVDSTGELAEFTRYGMNWSDMESNLFYIISNGPENIKFNLISLMTSSTVRDLKKMTELVERLYSINNNLTWQMFDCMNPRIHSMSTLPDRLKPEILDTLTELETKPYTEFVDVIKTVITNSKFNNTMYKELQEFLHEFSTRKHIEIPECLSDLTKP